MNLNQDILDEFYQTTKFDITKYFAFFTVFMKTDYNAIVNYYNGSSEIISTKSFENLNSLLAINEDLFALFSQSKDRFNNLKYWDLMLQIEDIQSTLQTVYNLDKWLRSPKTNTSFNAKTELQLTLSQYQTLELLNKNVLTEPDFQNSWIQTATRNDLREEDYTIEGGNLLNVTFSQSGSLFINAVVDNLIGEKVLGLDIYRVFTFENNDIKVLDYKETFKQSVYILSKLKKYDNPYLPNDGIDTNSIIGSNVNIINFPSIFRQMSNTFSTDDTIKNFAITDIKRESDAVFVIFTVKSRIDETDVFKIKLSN